MRKVVTDARVYAGVLPWQLLCNPCELKELLSRVPETAVAAISADLSRCRESLIESDALLPKRERPQYTKHYSRAASGRRVPVEA